MTLHRKAGARTLYHLDRLDWVRTGRAVCGEDTGRAGFVAGSAAEVERAGRRVCEHCARIADRNGITL